MTRSCPLRGRRSLPGTRLGAPGLGSIPSAWSRRSGTAYRRRACRTTSSEVTNSLFGTRCTLYSGWVSDSRELKTAARRGAPLEHVHEGSAHAGP
jgi:hypothetical protein